MTGFVVQSLSHSHTLSHTRTRTRTHIFYMYIYIYAFSRRFYPKRLTVHSGYTIFCQYVSMCVPWELNPWPFVRLTQCSNTEPQEHFYKNLFFFTWTSSVRWFHYLMCIWVSLKADIVSQHTCLVRTNKTLLISASSKPPPPLTPSLCQDIAWQIELLFEHMTGHLSKTSQKSSLRMFMKDISKLFLTWNVYIQSLRCERFRCHQNHLAPGV